MGRKEKFWNVSVWNLFVNIFGLCNKVGCQSLFESFVSALALVRELLGLLVLILVCVLDPGLTKGTLLLLLELIGVSGVLVGLLSGLVSPWTLTWTLIGLLACLWDSSL